MVARLLCMQEVIGSTPVSSNIIFLISRKTMWSGHDDVEYWAARHIIYIKYASCTGGTRPRRVRASVLRRNIDHVYDIASLVVAAP